MSTTNRQNWDTLYAMVARAALDAKVWSLPKLMHDRKARKTNRRRGAAISLARAFARQRSCFTWRDMKPILGTSASAICRYLKGKGELVVHRKAKSGREGWPAIYQYVERKPQ